jgi:acyl carrier protein
VLSKDSTVQQCVVMPREDTPGEKRLVAYMVPQHGQTPNVAELRQRLREQLSDYMMPTAFVILEALPLTPNGKVNRLALPPPHEVRPEVSTPQVAPRNRLEIQLVAIWEQVLGVSGIGVRENFFELGGHSLLALRIFGEIERSLGRRLPMVTLFQAPTIEQLADILTQEAWSAPWNSLIAIQTGGCLPPFFAVPGLGGNVLGFLEFAKLLGPDQPFYGLQSRGLDGIEKPFTRIEDMAAHYINEIRQVQPEGPYYLGGTCIGGVVAYEMAQQLQEQGHEVSLLTLIETWPPSSLRVPRFAVPFWIRPSLFLLLGIARHGRVLLQLRPGQWSSYMRQGMLIIRDMVAYGDVYRGDRAVLYRDRVSDANRQAAARYRPKPYSGRLSLILASSRPVAPSQDTRLAWGTLAADGYSTDQIPAEDSGRLFVKPHVQVLAGHLKTLLAQARAKR